MIFMMTSSNDPEIKFVFLSKTVCRKMQKDFYYFTENDHLNRCVKLLLEDSFNTSVAGIYEKVTMLKKFI